MSKQLQRPDRDQEDRDTVEACVWIPVEKLVPAIKHGLEAIARMGWIETYGISYRWDRVDSDPCELPELIAVAEQGQNRDDDGSLAATKFIHNSDWEGPTRFSRFILEHPRDWADIIEGKNWDVAASNLMQFMLYGEIRFA